MAALNRAQIYPGVHYRDNTLYTMYRFAQGTCPKAARASDRLISLPLHLRLTQTDVGRVAEQLILAVREHSVAGYSSAKVKLMDKGPSS